MLKVAVIIGSLRKESFNRSLVLALNKLNHPELTFNILNLKDVPLYNQDDEANLPTAVAEMKNAIENADGILFATPEYNRSIPGFLKNIIDWASRPYGKNSWAKKPLAIIGASPGAVGTAVAQSHLRSIMATVGGATMPQPEIYITFKPGMIDAEFNITDGGTRQFLQGFLDTFSAWLVNFHRK